MKRKITTISIRNWDELDDYIWDAIVEYTHELHGNDGHVQYAQDSDCIVYFVRPCNRLHKKDEEKDK